MAVEAGGVGARLRASREKLGLTVLQVAERLHTDPKIIEVIEAENYEALGAPVYARGHIRHYAELVGEPAAELIALYADSSKVGQPDLTRIVKAPSGSDSSKLVAPALLVIGVFAVAGAIWWVSALSKKQPQMSETHVVGDESQPAVTASAPASTSTPAPAAAPASAPPLETTAPAPALPASTAATPAPVPESPPPAATARAQPRTTPSTGARAATQSRSGGTTVGQRGTTAPARTVAAVSAGTSPARTVAAVPGGASTVPSAAAASGGALPATSVAAVPGSTAPARVTLRYSADSWTEVYDASGARLFYDVGAANSVQTLVGTPPLRIVLGNAPGVAIEFNGHNTPLANLPHPDGSVQFSISRSGHVVRAKPGAGGG